MQKQKKTILLKFFREKNISHEDFKKFTGYEKKIISDLLKDGAIEKLITEDKNDSCEYNKKEIRKIELNSDQHKAYECVIKIKMHSKLFCFMGQQDQVKPKFT